MFFLKVKVKTHHNYENKSFFAFTHVRRNDTICIMKYSYLGGMMMRRTVKKWRRNASRHISLLPVLVIVGAPVLTYFIVRLLLVR